MLKTYFITGCTILSLLLTGCCLFRSNYPDTCPQYWKDQEKISSERQDLGKGITRYSWHFKNFHFPGIYIHKRDFPVSVHLIVADWNETGYHTALAVKAYSNGSKPIEEHFSSKQGKVLAAVNGCHTDMAGKPVYALKANGIMVPASVPAKAFATHMLVANDTAFPQILPATEETLKRYPNAIQGHALALNGRSMFSHTISGQAPYTAIGLNPALKLVFIFVCDGYHDESTGLSLSDVPAILLSFGARDVILLGSDDLCVMAVSDEDGNPKIVSHPSGSRNFDDSGAKALQNSVVLFTKPEGKR